MTDDAPPVVNVGLIGLGFAGTRLHLPPLQQNRCAQIVSVCDEDSTRSSGFRTAHDQLSVRSTTNWEDVVTDPIVNAVFIATPTPTHLKIAAAALENGKHVFCEKPVSLTMADAQTMLAASQKRPQQMLMIGQVLRFWPDYVQAYNLVKQGKLGQVRIARTFRACSMPSGWYADEEQSGGVVLDLALHDIDFLVWTLGEVDSVFAQGENCLGKGKAHFIDYAQIHLNFKSGAIAHVEASWAVPHSFPFTTSLEICGSDGMLQMDNSDQNTSLEIFPDSASAAKSGPHEYNGYFHEIDAFIKAVQQKESKPPVGVADVIHPLQVALAAKESIRTNSLIKLSPETAKAGAV